jgi:hypothetical protein
MLENNKNYLLYGNYQNPAVGTETQTLFYTYILVFIAITIGKGEGYSGTQGTIACPRAQKQTESAQIRHLYSKSWNIFVPPAQKKQLQWKTVLNPHNLKH